MAEKTQTKIPICLSAKLSKKKPKIVFLIWNTKKCGGNKVVFEYANRLQKRGYQIKIFSVFNKNVDWFNLKVKIAPFFRLGWFGARTDILIATFWPTVYLSFFMPARKKFYFVLGWESDYYTNPLLSFLARTTYKLPFYFIAISNFLREKIKTVNQKKDIFLCPIAIDLNIFKPSRLKRKNQKKPACLPAGIFFLSVISSYQLYKGLDNLIALIRLLKEKHPRRFSFTLISFEKESCSSVFDKFISHASTKDLVNEYCKADLFLAASRVEGFFLPGLEAMACGCPVVMTDSGGVREYTKNGYNCLLAKNFDEIIKKKMVEKVLNNSVLRNRLIKNGLKTAKKFTWEKSVKKLERILIDEKF